MTEEQILMARIREIWTICTFPEHLNWLNKKKKNNTPWIGYFEDARCIQNMSHKDVENSMNSVRGFTRFNLMSSDDLYDYITDMVKGFKDEEIMVEVDLSSGLSISINKPDFDDLSMLEEIEELKMYIKWL